MSQRLVVFLILIAICWMPLAHAHAEDRDTNRTAIAPKPRELPLIPRGIGLGMTVAELKSLRPNLKPLSFQFTIPGERQPTSRPSNEESFGETTGEGEFRSATTYGTKGDKLNAVSVVCRYAPRSFATERSRIVREYRDALGPNPEWYVRSVKGRDFDYLEPCLVWRDADSVVAVCMTPEFTEVSAHFGQVQVFWLREPTLLDRMLVKYDRTLHARLFSDLRIDQK